MLIGNLTRDPNLRFTPSNTAVCSFGLATNRSWTPADGGEKQEKTEFHNVVAWGKLAEICGQILHKGDKAFVEGRLQTRDWKTSDGAERRITEIIIDDMMLLRSKSGYGSYSGEAENRNGGGREAGGTDDQGLAGDEADTRKPAKKTPKKVESETDQESEVTQAEDVSEDIPF